MLVVPIAFVSEHSETLVELDIDYRELAARAGVPRYFRAPAPNADAGFIAALAGLVRRMRGFGPGTCSHAGGRTCPGAAYRLPVCPRRPARTDGIAVTALELMRNRTAPLRLVIFDCDGVMVDSEPVSNRVVVGALTELGWPMTPGGGRAAVSRHDVSRHGADDRSAALAGRCRRVGARLESAADRRS